MYCGRTPSRVSQNIFNLLEAFMSNKGVAYASRGGYTISKTPILSAYLPPGRDESRVCTDDSAKLRQTTLNTGSRYLGKRGRGSGRLKCPRG